MPAARSLAVAYPKQTKSRPCLSFSIDRVVYLKWHKLIWYGMVLEMKKNPRPRPRCHARLRQRVGYVLVSKDTTPDPRRLDSERYVCGHYIVVKIDMLVSWVHHLNSVLSTSKPASRGEHGQNACSRTERLTPTRISRKSEGVFSGILRERESVALTVSEVRREELVWNGGEGEVSKSALLTVHLFSALPHGPLVVH